MKAVDLCYKVDEDEGIQVETERLKYYAKQDRTLSRKLI